MFSWKDTFNYGFEGLTDHPCGMGLEPQIVLEDTKDVKPINILQGRKSVGYKKIRCSITIAWVIWYLNMRLHMFVVRSLVAQRHVLSVHTDTSGSPMIVVVLRRNEASYGFLVRHCQRIKHIYVSVRPNDVGEFVVFVFTCGYDMLATVAIFSCCLEFYSTK